MPNSVEKLQSIITNHLSSWKLEELPSEENYKDAKLLISPEGEEMVISFVNINITGRDRPKPQIRIFMDGQHKIYKWALENEKRFFLMTIFTHDLSDAPNMNHINPQEYIVSIESNLENQNGRVDIRSMYDYLSQQPLSNFVRCSIGMHKTSLSQASFIRVENNGVVDVTEFENYLRHFDSRPYTKCIRNIIQYVNTTSNNKLTSKKMPYNLLINGAPGTGKSHYIDKKLYEVGNIKQMATIAQEAGDTTDIKILEQTAEKEFFDKFVHRVTFYEDYTYENFIGAYKPVPQMKINEVEYDGKQGKITSQGINYSYEAGAFIDMYVKATQDRENNYYLIIEEINRANAASVFGDMFQLLDRKNGISEYAINPEPNLARYLMDNYGICGKMRLPDNLYIWGTLNNADQGVFPLDTAFKRRWSSLYMDINEPRVSSNGDTEIAIALFNDSKLQYIKWDSFRMAINAVILSNGFDEDRCIGPWYFTDEELVQIQAYMSETSTDSRRDMPNPLVDKLFSYLKQDVFRTNPSAIFKPIQDQVDRLPSMSDLRKAILEDRNILNILNIHLEASEWKDKKEDFMMNSSDAHNGE